MTIGTIFTGVMFLCLLGCVTTAQQTLNLQKFPPQNILDFHEIENVPFVDQSQGYCGPATLTMAMRWAGEDISATEVAELVYTPGFQGSLQSDMVSASRRLGMMAIPIYDLKNLLIEVTANHPVIVFENLGLSWAPQWHYALVIGYDLRKQEIIMHSGHKANLHWNMEKFERSWMLGDYWGLVVLPAGELAATGDELSHINAAVGLEMANRKEAALISYKKILEKWPNSYVALLGLANLEFQKGNRKESVRWLRLAVRLFPESQMARHNLSVAESH